jgi:hypothetical protein
MAVCSIRRISPTGSTTYLRQALVRVGRQAWQEGTAAHGHGCGVPCGLISVWEPQIAGIHINLVVSLDPFGEGPKSACRSKSPREGDCQ